MSLQNSNEIAISSSSSETLDIMDDSPKRGSNRQSAEGNLCFIADSQICQSHETQRTLQLEDEVTKLRQSLISSEIAAQKHSYVLTAHLRGQAKFALDFQQAQFRTVAKQHEKVSVDITAAAVAKESSDQQAMQRRQFL